MKAMTPSTAFHLLLILIFLSPALANVNSLEANERDAVMSLEEAQQNLQKAAAVHLSIGKCDAQIAAVISSLSNAETSLLQDQYSDALDQISSAQKTLSDCNGALTSSDVHSSKALLFLTKQASAYIEQSQNLIKLFATQDGAKDALSNAPVPATTVSDVQMGGDINRCVVDGSKCQYSSCGVGRQLPICAVGFAAGVIGGAKGKSYVVTNEEDDPRDPKEGSLRYGTNLASTEPSGIWITFSRDMVIRLHEMLWINSSTTIDGRGFNITITGRELVLGAVNNVILHNFQLNTVGESDTVHIFSGSSKIWVDHVTSFDANLGLISVCQGATDVTISNSFLTNKDYNMLLGASDADIEDKKMRVTVYRNWFKDSNQQQPHCRWGYCHVINNLYTNWGDYAIGARANGKILSESNVFIAGAKREVTPWHQNMGPDFDNSATIQSSNDLLLNSSTFQQMQGLDPAHAGAIRTSLTPQYESSAHYPPVHPTSTLAALVQLCSGALFGKKLEECQLFQI